MILCLKGRAVGSNVDLVGCVACVLKRRDGGRWCWEWEMVVNTTDDFAQEAPLSRCVLKS